MHILIVKPFERHSKLDLFNNIVESPSDSKLDLISVKAENIVQSVPHTSDLCHLFNIHVKSPSQILRKIRQGCGMFRDATLHKVKPNATLGMIVPNTADQVLNKTASWFCMEPIIGPVVFFFHSGQDFTKESWASLMSTLTPHLDFLHVAGMNFCPDYIHQLSIQSPIISSQIKLLPYQPATSRVFQQFYQDYEKHSKVNNLETNGLLRCLTQTKNLLMITLCSASDPIEGMVTSSKQQVVSQMKLLDEFTILNLDLCMRLFKFPQEHVFVHIIDVPSRLDMWIHLDLQTKITLVKFGLQLQWYEIDLRQEPTYIKFHKLCGQCKQGGCKLKCQCAQVYYCNQECQRRDWTTHKEACLAQPNANRDAQKETTCVD